MRIRGELSPCDKTRPALIEPSSHGRHIEEIPSDDFRLQPRQSERLKLAEPIARKRIEDSARQRLFIARQLDHGENPIASLSCDSPGTEVGKGSRSPAWTETDCQPARAMHWMCSPVRFAPGSKKRSQKGQLRLNSSLGRPSPRPRIVLLISPTGTGKTLAAFLAILDRLFRAEAEGSLSTGVRCVYISPLRSLNYDIERNLKRPLDGIRQQLGREKCPVLVGVRTGDTSPRERRLLRDHPPHVLITTPESLSLLLSQESWTPLWRGVRHVVIDEVHALAPTKRGADLAVSLERLAKHSQRDPVRVGSFGNLPLGRRGCPVRGRRHAHLPGHSCTASAGHAADRNLRRELDQTR